MDVPRIGLTLWTILLALLLPPTALTLLGTQIGPFPNQTLWVILLGVPFPLLLLSLPRRYELDAHRLTVSGLFYRIRVHRVEIEDVTPVPLMTALVHPSSLFCSDPARALRVSRRTGRPLIISPHDPAPFLALGKHGPPPAHG